LTGGCEGDGRCVRPEDVRHDADRGDRREDPRTPGGEGP
jgi:hypothetical protein